MTLAFVLLLGVIGTVLLLALYTPDTNGAHITIHIYTRNYR